MTFPKVRHLLIAGLIGFAVVFSTGCASFTGAVLKNFKPDQRKEYRDGLEQATDAYDGLYDRDGQPLD